MIRHPPNARTVGRPRARHWCRGPSRTAPACRSRQLRKPFIQARICGSRSSPPTIRLSRSESSLTAGHTSGVHPGELHRCAIPVGSVQLQSPLGDRVCQQADPSAVTSGAARPERWASGLPSGPGLTVPQVRWDSVRGRWLGAGEAGMALRIQQVDVLDHAQWLAFGGEYR